MSNSLLSRENVVPFPFGQTLPEESDGPKWQQDWGLIGSNPGVRILSMDLLFLIFLFSSFSNFPHFLISSFSYFLFGSTSHYWNPSNRKKVLLTQLGLRPRNTDDRIDSQMFVLKVEFISFLFLNISDVHFKCSIVQQGDQNEHPSNLDGEVGKYIY